jgi:hypothetical protein
MDLVWCHWLAGAPKIEELDPASPQIKFEARIVATQQL